MDGWLAAAFLSGLGLIGLYLRLAHQNERSPEFLTGARLFLAAVLALAGIKLAYLAISTDDADLKPFAGEDRLYILIGSLAMMWIAFADTYRELKSIGSP